VSNNHPLWLRLMPQFVRQRLGHRTNLLAILHNIGWLFADKILRVGLGLIVGVWVARYLGPEKFGQFNYCVSFVSLFGAFAGLGLNGIVVRNLVNHPHSYNEVLGTAFALQLIAGLVGMILAIFFISFLQPNDQLLRLLVTILSISLIFKSSEVIKFWFESKTHSRHVVLVENFIFVCMAAVKVFLILDKATLETFVWVTLIEAILVFLGLFAIYESKVGQFSFWSIRSCQARKLLKDSWPLTISSVAIIIYMRIDQVMLGHMLSQEAVGIYSAAARISEAWYFIPMMVVSSVFPKILATKALDEKLYTHRIQQLYNFLTMIAITVALFFSFTSDLIVNYLYGDKFSEAASILSIQIWSGIFVAMGVARGKWLLAENLQRVGYWYILAAMFINVILNYLLIPIYGAIGAALATIASQSTAAIIAPALFKKTRVSAVMLVRSLNPVEWVGLLSDFLRINSKGHKLK